MKEHPIIFSSPLVRAILEDRKTQTRRVIKPQPGTLVEDIYHRPDGPWIWLHLPRGAGVGLGLPFACPYGKPGDLLVLKSQWATEKQYDKLSPSKLPRKAKIWTLFDGTEKPAWCGRTRSARFIPKRLYPYFPKAEITDVRVERVQEISTEDAIAEGCWLTPKEASHYSVDPPEFIWIWDSINLKRGYGWKMNPWVWVLSFKRKD